MKLKFGVIGAGGRGGVSHQAHQPDSDSYLVAAADVREQPLERFKKKFGESCFVTKDYHELLTRDVDAVFICSPDYLHEEQALASLEAGKHVFLEKPMAITIEGCDRILKKAKERNKKLYLGHNMRHMSFVRKMKDIVDSGTIGDVKSVWCRHFVGNGGDWYFKDWHADRKKSTSLLLQKAAHDIDVIHWICDGFTEQVTAMGQLSVYGDLAQQSPGAGKNQGMDMGKWPPETQRDFNPVVDVEDLSMMLMKLNNGILCSYQQCHFTPDNWRNYTILGTKGRIENFNDTPGQTVVRVWNERRCQYNSHGDHQYYIPSESGGHGGADPLMVNEFVAWIRGETSPSTSPIAARYAVAAGCCAADSLRNGSVPVSVPELTMTDSDYFE
jgi:predicted dehydrogenase